MQTESTYDREAANAVIARADKTMNILEEWAHYLKEHPSEIAADNIEALASWLLRFCQLAEAESIDGADELQRFALYNIAQQVRLYVKELTDLGVRPAQIVWA